MISSRLRSRQIQIPEPYLNRHPDVLNDIWKRYHSLLKEKKEVEAEILLDSAGIRNDYVPPEFDD